MKRILLSVVIITTTIGSFSLAQSINVDWNKTTHILFDTDINYVSSNENLILTDKQKNILSVKASSEHFNDATLNVSTLDGNFYTFSVNYVDLNLSPIVNKGTNLVHTQEVGINEKKSAHIIFDDQVQYLDFGTDSIQSVIADNTTNIVRIDCLTKFNLPTNVGVLLKNGTFFNIDVIYSDSINNNTITIGEKQALISEEIVSSQKEEEIIKQVKNRSPEYTTIGITQNSIVFGLSSIYIKDNKLVFIFDIRNKSNIPYDIDYLKFYLVDKKKSKTNAEQEIEIIPTAINGNTTTIDSKDKRRVILAFDKFTIGSLKQLNILLKEKDGNRNISLSLKSIDNYIKKI